MGEPLSIVMQDPQLTSAFQLCSDSHYRQVVENSPNAIFSVNRHGQIQIWNQSCEALYGYSRQNVATMAVNEFVMPTSNDLVVDHLIQQVFDGTPLTGIELVYRCRDGGVRFTISRLYPLCDRHGKVDSCVFANTDITERRQAEFALEASYAELKALFASIDQLIIVLDRDGRYLKVWVNDKDILVRPLEDMLGRRVHEIFPPDQADYFLAVIHRALDTGKSVEVEYSIDCQDGRRLWSDARVSPIDDNTVVWVVRDITQRKSLEMLLRQRAHQQQALSQVIQAIHQSLDLQVVFHTAITEVCSLVQVDSSAIMQYVPEQEQWVHITGTPSSSGAMTQMTQWAIPDRGNPIAARLKNREIVQIDHGSQLSLAFYSAHAASAIPSAMPDESIPCSGSWLVIPIVVESSKSVSGFVWGCFCMVRRQPSPWKAWEVELATCVTDQLAIAICQSELYHQVQQLNASLEQQVADRTAELAASLDYEAALKRITDHVRDSLDEDHILHTVVHELVSSLDIHCCDVALYNLDQQVSTIAYEAIRDRVLPARKESFPMHKMPDIYVHLLQGQTVQFCVVRPPDGSPRGSKQEFTMFCCPIMDDRGVLGDLWLFKDRSAWFMDLEMRLVQQVANQCAIALRQSRLYQASQKQVQELARLNTLKDDFLSTVSHELQTPMSNIRMATQMLEMLLQQDGDLDRNRLTRYVRILKDESDREIELINDLLDLNRLEANAESLTISTIHLQDWIPRVAERFVQRASAHQQQLDIQIPEQVPPLATDMGNLERILTELLLNACKYTPAGEIISIHCYTTMHEEEHAYNAPQADKLHISVINTGTVIPAEELPRIFDKFYRIPSHDPWKHGGTGLGLALVKKLAASLQGSVSAHSHPNQTCFTLTLPIVLEPSFP